MVTQQKPKELNKIIRTRFAPAPSGSGKIHLGNIRAALVNLLFAKKNNGVFVLRIEDTDVEKSGPDAIKALLNDLQWLNIFFDEGPGVGGNFGPYFQSQRNAFYQEYLEKFISANMVYRCFCSEQRLAELKKEQLMRKEPPRYDRHCFGIPEETISNKIKEKEPFVWRIKIDHNKTVSFNDIIRGNLSFNLKNFSDFVIRRSNGNFNFLFANFVDDVLMKISHIIRGEDHLSNSALQVFMYEIINQEIPVFMHLPMILDEDGQKLSKSAQNFDLSYLKKEGFLAEAICNYLVSLGSNLNEQPYSFEELVKEFNPESLSTQSVKYEISKIKSLNQKWLQRFSATELMQKIISLLQLSVPHNLREAYVKAIEVHRPHAHTLVELFDFCKTVVERPLIPSHLLKEINHLSIEKLIKATTKLLYLKSITMPILEELITTENLTKKEFFTFFRLACTGLIKGITINEILSLLQTDEIIKRLAAFCKILNKEEDAS